MAAIFMGEATFQVACKGDPEGMGRAQIVYK
jgi:hypothetical protein